MLNQDIYKLVKEEIQNTESDEIQKAYQEALQAVEHAKETGMYPDVEQAKEKVSSLPSGDAKKALMKVLKKIPRREKLSSLSELREKGLTIIEEDEVTVENNIMQILKEKGLLVSDLAKLTGISRQNINAVVKNKMKPGVDFVLKVSYVLGKPVEEIFKLTENAWVKPYKQEKDSTLYLDVVHLEIVDNTIKKESIARNGYEYFNQETEEFLTKEEYNERLKQFLKENTSSKAEELKKENPDLSSTRLNSLAKEELRREFSEKNIKIYKKLGEVFHPYVINSKKVKKGGD